MFNLTWKVVPKFATFIFYSVFSNFRLNKDDCSWICYFCHRRLNSNIFCFQRHGGVIPCHMHSRQISGQPQVTASLLSHNFVVCKNFSIWTAWHHLQSIMLLKPSANLKLLVSKPYTFILFDKSYYIYRNNMRRYNNR